MSTAVAETAWNAAVRQIIATKRAMPGALLPILHDIQHALGDVPADALVAHAKAALGCDFHRTSSDGAITLEPVYCLGHALPASARNHG